MVGSSQHILKVLDMPMTMTRAEVAAYNCGIEAVADIARKAADAMRAKLKQKPTRYPFAIEALEALIDEARGLMLPDDEMPASGPGKPDNGRPRAGGAVCVPESV